ncbi:class I SAM-dependent methyltransferase [Sesbania bispinosa]|nr:class I SAM-dependent methyltransferase [Sesbania bispinosa]
MPSFAAAPISDLSLCTTSAAAPVSLPPFTSSVVGCLRRLRLSYSYDPRSE